MKFKKIQKNILLLILILSLTVVSSLNQDFTSRNTLETPKSSAGEITIITPENKTYTEPDTGYYPGTFGFENDLNGAVPFNWVDTSSPPCYAKIVDGIGGHNKVLEVYGRGQTSSDYAHLFNYFDPQTSGTIEWWWRKSSTLSSCAKFIVSNETTGLIDFRMDWYADPGKIEYYGSGWTNTGYIDYTDDKWIHMKLSFDCTADVYNVTIDGVLYLNNIPFPNGYSPTHISNVKFYTYAAANPTLYYVDAVGYSWDPNYHVGDNLNEGLLLSYDNTTTLQWQGYSLDGQENVTVYGNYTLPLPANGTHTIQVFGNNSIGTSFQSDLRYFTYGTTSIPQITIISPTLNEFFTSVAPDFQISIFGTSIDTTWYTIDGGVTNITFSGLTGAINQTEWDKKGDGDVNLRFYVNNTQGNSSYTDVTIKKDTTAPLITIDSPLANGVFGKLAPQYNLTIIESNIELIWYTLDYGQINITHILPDGFINQLEWDKIGNGTADIRFSVLDSAGNVAYADVTIRKNISDPILVINAPMEFEVFGITAPFFNVTVIEPDFDSMWYTLDDGINNITASGFTGDISQTEWNKKVSSIFNIRFYANDTLGNMGYAEIAVEKDITDPIIQVNIPIVDAIFGYNAPSYDISITEANLDSMWYTLDNGLTNISISSFTGILNQTEWAKIPHGLVSLSFFINDTVGQLGYSIVNFNKDLYAPTTSIDFTLYNPPNLVLASTQFTFTASDNSESGVSTTQYKINDSAWIPYTGAFTLVGYDSGVYTITYQSIDSVGNVEIERFVEIELYIPPPPPPPPPDLSFLIYIAIGVAVALFGILYVKVIRPKTAPKREIKKEKKAEQARLKRKFIEQREAEAEKLRQQQLEQQRLKRERVLRQQAERERIERERLEQERARRELEKQRIIELEKQKQLEEERAIIEKIRIVMDVSTRIKMDLLRNYLKMNETLFYDKIFIWAKQFGFSIDGDYLNIKKENVSDFIDELEKQFKGWRKSERDYQDKV